MRFEFDWDPAKAASNFAEHGVSFEEAMAVFHDPLALSRPDEDHGANVHSALPAEAGLR